VKLQLIGFLNNAMFWYWFLYVFRKQQAYSIPTAAAAAQQGASSRLTAAASAVTAAGAAKRVCRSRGAYQGSTSIIVQLTQQCCQCVLARS
jgi:hypothetical protein